MSKFKIGDKVVRSDMDLGGIGSPRTKTLFSNGSVLTVSFVNDVYELISFKEVGGQYDGDAFKLYDDPSKHHKHHDMIIAWAKGAEIQYYDRGFEEWLDYNTPSWNLSTIYRIKPTKADIRQQKINDIESEMRKLADQLNELLTDRLNELENN